MTTTTMVMTYDYTPAACIEHHGDYDYAPASSMYGDDDDDGRYDYAPATWIAFTVTTT